ncbi:MAG: hypothetical protein WDZ28_05070 [Simkaniaceae bacterium]
MQSQQAIKHPWKIRFIVGLVMILLALVGLIISTLRQDGAWQYWRIMVPVFALICLFFSWYLRREKESVSLVKVWHEILHWIGLMLAVLLVSVFVSHGIMSRFGASLQVLTLLSFSLFLAGVYIETSFMPIGILLGFFAAGAGIIAEYLYTVMIPLTIAAIIILFFVVKKRIKSIEP